MKRFISLGVTALALVSTVLLSGCGETKPTVRGWKPSATEKPAEIKATVTWWNNYQVPEDPANEAEDRTKNMYTEYFYAKDAITEFNKLYPNIKIVTSYKGNYAAIQKAVSQGTNTGDFPSMSSCYADFVAGYIKDGIALNVDECINDPYIGFGKTVDTTGAIVDDPTTTLADFNENYLNGERAQYADKLLYSMPYSKSGEILTVSKSLFDKVGSGECGFSAGNYVAPVAKASKEAYKFPETWTELIDVARKIKADFPEIFENNIDQDGMFKAVPFCYDSGENMYITLCEMLGIPYTNPNGTVAEQILFRNDKAKELMVLLKKLNNEGLIATQNQLYFTDKSRGYHQYSSSMITEGKCFMCITSTTGATYFAQDGLLCEIGETPSIDRSVFGESATKTKSKVMSQGPAINFFKKNDENEQKATWLFYKFLTSTQYSAKLSVAKSYFPLRESSYNTDDIKRLTNAYGTADINSAYKDKQNAYTGTVLKLNGTYTDGGRYFTSPAFALSSTTRTAVGNIVNSLFNDKTAKTDEEIKALVDSAFEEAYKAVVTNA